MSSLVPITAAEMVTPRPRKLNPTPDSLQTFIYKPPCSSGHSARGTRLQQLVPHFGRCSTRPRCVSLVATAFLPDCWWFRAFEGHLLFEGRCSLDKASVRIFSHLLPGPRVCDAPLHFGSLVIGVLNTGVALSQRTQAPAALLRFYKKPPMTHSHKESLLNFSQRT